MRATREVKPKVFEPVVVTLESQAEVDGLFAMLNHIRVRETLGLTYGSYEALKPYRNRANSDVLWEALDDMVK